MSGDDANSNDENNLKNSAQIMRRFSRALTRTTEHIESAVEDVTTFLDLSEQVECVLEGSEPVEDEAIKPSTPPAAKAVERKETMEQKLGSTMMDPTKVIFWDKVTFFFGVSNVSFTAFLLGRSPQNFYHYWTFKCIVLFTIRWLNYRKKGWHYLMLELCYVGNIIGIIFCYFYHQSAVLRKLAFAYSAGPLMWSILAMRNSLVFHSLDHTTTLMMHASPAITAWTFRWYSKPQWTSGFNNLALNNYNNASWYDMIIFPTFSYLLWVVIYYILTFVLLRNRIEGRGRLTMFSLMVPKDKEKAARNPLARIVLKAPEPIQPIVYLCCHGIAACIAFLPTKIFWDHFYVHSGALLFCIGLSIWNGANYYFKVFAKQYLAKLGDHPGNGSAAVRFDETTRTDDRDVKKQL